MKVFVTGGNGFIGTHLIKHLIKNNFQITVFDNLSNSKNNNIMDNVNFVKGDIRDFKLLQKSMKGHDIVIHLAAKISVFESKEESENTMDVNVKGSQNILKSCNDCKISKLIAMSSAAIYGEGDKNISHVETDTSNPISTYGKSKLKMEQEIIKFSKKIDFDSIIFRLFNVYGEGQSDEYAGVIKRFVNNVLHNKPITIFGNGEQTRDFIHISDVIKYIHIAINSNNRGKKVEVYNIATGKIISVNELAQMIFTLIKKEQAITYSKLIKGDILFSCGNIVKSKRIFNYSPKIKLEDGIIKLLNK